MSDVVNAELLRLLDESIEIYGPGDSNMVPITVGDCRALKSRLQAEAPEDAQVAAIIERHEAAERDFENGREYPFDAIVFRQRHADRGVLLAKLRARTSQAEARAPTTAAPMCEHENAVAIFARTIEPFCWKCSADMPVPDISYEAYVMGTAPASTVGAPAPAPTTWMPIETAPKDGAVVDLWLAPTVSGGRGKRVTDIRWNTNRSFRTPIGAVRQEDAWTYSHGEQIYAHQGTPTHWSLPLAPPASAKGDTP